MSNSTLYDAIGPFTVIPNAVVEHMEVIGVDAFALFAYLRYRTHSKRGVAFPSYDRIRKDTGMSFRRIAGAIKTLMVYSAMSRRKRFGHSTEYTLRVPGVWTTEEVNLDDPQNPNESTVLSTVEDSPSNGGGHINTESIKNEKETTIVANATEAQFPITKGIAESLQKEHGMREVSNYQKVVKELTEWFVDLTKIKFIDPVTDKDKKAANVRWWMPLWKVYKYYCDEDIDQTKRVVEKAYRQLINGDMTVSSPASVFQVAISIVSKSKAKKVVVIR